MSSSSSASSSSSSSSSGSSHALSPINLKISLPQLASFHPTIRISVQGPLNSTSDSDEECRAYVVWNIPDGVFVDPNELQDKFFLSPSASLSPSSSSSSELDVGNVKSNVVGWKIGPEDIDVDIERPIFQRNKTAESPHTHTHTLWLAIAIDASAPGGYVDIPLHGRYLDPSSTTSTSTSTSTKSQEEQEEDGMKVINIPDDDGEGTIRAGMTCATSPLQDLNLSVDWPDIGLLPTISSAEIQGVQIPLPTGYMSHQPLVELVTPLVIWSGWAWLIYKIVRLKWRLDVGRKDKRD